MSNIGIENFNRSISIDPGFELRTPHAGTDKLKNGQNFADILESSLEDVNRDQVQADEAIKELIAGRTKNIHETMLAIERAEMSMKLMMQVRNKILDAYREVMKMQV